MPLTTVFRLADWSTPLWVDGNRSPARYNRPGQPTQYLCLHPLGPWAEFLRREGLAAEDLSLLRHRLWALRLDLDGAVQIGWDDAATHGVRPGDLVSDDHRPCQALADRLRAEGVTTVVVPSAALPGTRNVVVFGPRVASAYPAEPVDAEVDVPAALAAEDATTLASLAALVRRPGRRHAELEAWRRGRTFVFEEPAV